jgi:hypothetical protein
MLLAQKSYVEGALALVLYCAKLADDRRCDDSEQARADANALLDLLTPACRFFFEAELPKIRPLLAFGASGSDVAADMPPAAF